MDIENITLVMLNWKRPANVSRLLTHYLQMPFITKAIIFDNNPAAGLKLPIDSRIAAIAASEDLGLPTRFAAAALARTRLVFNVDDDILVPESEVKKLYAAHIGSEAGVTGLLGRRPVDGVYFARNKTGSVPIVLTRAVFLTPEIAAKALLASMQMALTLPGSPFGNGEDIVMSYVAMQHTGKPNFVPRVGFKNIVYDDKNAISRRCPDHLQHRTAVVAYCEQHIVAYKDVSPL